MGGPSDPFAVRAGSGARAIFRRKVRRTLLLWLALVVPVIAVVIAIPGMPGGLRMVPVLLVVAIVATWKDTRELYDEVIRPWLKGARGEEQVGRALAALPSGYHVLHDIDCGGWNIDHVVIGPTGVTVVETKAWTGKVYLGPGGKLMRNGQDEDKTIRQVHREIAKVKERLHHAGLAPYIRGIIALPATELPKGRIDRNRITVLEAGELVDHIVHGRQQFSDPEVKRATYCIGKDQALPAMRVRLDEGSDTTTTS